MFYIIPGVLLFLVCVVLARFQAEKGLKVLTNEQRGELLQAYSKTRLSSILILSGIIAGFLLVAYYGHVDKTIAMVCYFAAILIYFVVNGLTSFNRMKKMRLPAEYMRHTRNATWLRIAGLCIFIICMGIGLYMDFMDQMLNVK